MASYTDLYGIRQDSVLINRVSIAVAIKAQSYIDGATPTADELNWAAKVLPLAGGRAEAEKLLQYLLASNNTATITQITGSTDATLQSAVNDAVDALVGGGVI